MDPLCVQLEQQGQKTWFIAALKYVQRSGESYEKKIHHLLKL